METDICLSFMNVFKVYSFTIFHQAAKQVTISKLKGTETHTDTCCLLSQQTGTW